MRSINLKVIGLTLPMVSNPPGLDSPISQNGTQMLYSGWAREPVSLFQWYSSQAGTCPIAFIYHWVAALHDYLSNSYLKAPSGPARLIAHYLWQ